MPDDPPDEKPAARRDQLPRRVDPPAAERVTRTSVEDPRPTVATWQYSYSGKTTGTPGFIAGALILAAVMLALVLGAVAITMVLWVALSLVVVGIVVAFVRRLFGIGGPRDGRGPGRGGGSSGR